MRNWILGLLMLATPLLSPAAPQIRVAENNSEVVAAISTDEPTRIHLVGDRIKSIKKKTGDFTVSNDNKTGDIYITPMKTVNTRKTINLFVVSEKGMTYQLLLTKTDMPGGQVFIKNVGANADLAYQWEIKTPYKASAIRLYLSMSKGEHIPGYTVNLSSKIVELWDEAFVMREGTYSGANMVGEIYRITNTSDVKLVFEEREFNRKGVIGVKANKLSLAPDESTMVYVILDADKLARM
ncbi:MAG: type-F conjugative transfer system secretin TraK [Gammaproteobacteria bacterium]|nr:type-F conjugative transfer system secretin TraK [Gammaproteobacteria bacterium]